MRSLIFGIIVLWLIAGCSAGFKTAGNVSANANIGTGQAVSGSLQAPETPIASATPTPGSTPTPGASPAPGSTPSPSSTPAGPTPTPQIEMVATTDFGAVTLGQQASTAYPVSAASSNTGPMQVTVQISGSAAFGLADSSQANFTVMPGQTQNIVVIYLPKTAGADQGVLDITFGNVDYRVPLTGSGVAPVEPTIDFGTIAIGLSENKGITITAPNTNTGPMSVTAKLSGSTAFSLANTSSATFQISPGQTEVVSVNYVPVNPEADSAELDVTYLGVEHKVPLTGVGVSPSTVCVAHNIVVEPGTTLTSYLSASAPCVAVTLTCEADRSLNITVTATSTFYNLNPPAPGLNASSSVGFGAAAGTTVTLSGAAPDINGDNLSYTFFTLPQSCH